MEKRLGENHDLTHFSLGASLVSLVSEQRRPWDAQKSHSRSGTEARQGQNGTREAESSGEGGVCQVYPGAGVGGETKNLQTW